MSKFLSIDFEYDHDYTLIGIHTPLEDSRLAYLLNQNLDLEFRRYKEDLDLFYKNEQSSFSIFIFDDQKNMAKWTLISNKNLRREPIKNKEENLFENEQFISYLIPEKKRVDFFIKIDSIFTEEFNRTVIEKIKNINKVIALYAIDPYELKSKDHLIFETKTDHIYL